jgi:DNA-binding transcriptional LysR family regulator
MENLADIAVFVQVVDAGSFTAAADRLNVSKAAVSKYVTRLETTLGARLLQRTTRRLALTEAGEALYAKSSGALAELVQAQQDVAHLTGAPRGHLRVTAPTYFGTTILAPLLKDFVAMYPEIQLALDLDDRISDLVKDRFDVAVRISAQVDPGLVARRLAETRLMVVGSPAYFRRRPPPTTPAELKDHLGLGYSLARVPDEWSLRAPNGRWLAVRMACALHCNSDFVLKQAALDGLGLALLPRFFVAREIEDGRLAQALPAYRGQELVISLVYASRRNLLPKVRAFVDFVAARLSGRAL